MDIELHSPHYDPFGEKSIFQLQQEMAPKYAVIPPLADDRFLCSFGHIFAGGYSAGYYSYKWAGGLLHAMMIYFMPLLMLLLGFKMTSNPSTPSLLYSTVLYSTLFTLFFLPLTFFSILFYFYLNCTQR